MNKRFDSTRTTTYKRRLSKGGPVFDLKWEHPNGFKGYNPDKEGHQMIPYSLRAKLEYAANHAPEPNRG